MGTVELIDYAQPCMKAEDALERAHQAMLHNNYDEALVAAMDAIVETKMMYNSIIHMKENKR
jgi:3-hydroxy-3-methylglutaryl CoA synthase